MGVISGLLCGEEGVCFCKAVRAANSRFQIQFEYVSLDGAKVEDQSLLRAVRAGSLLTDGTRVVTVPHPGYNDTKRCRQQNMLIDALVTRVPKATVVIVKLADRVAACEVVSERPVGEEAMTVVTGGQWCLRPEAEQFGTPLHDELFRLEATYMKEEAARFLQDPTKCSNSAEAFAAYTALGQEPGAFVYAADVLWNAVSEALTVSTGYKRPHAEGAFIHSDTYWGYEWWEGEDSGGEIGDWGDEGVHSEEPSQEEQQLQQQQQAPVLRKRQRLTAETAA